MGVGDGLSRRRDGLMPVRDAMRRARDGLLRRRGALVRLGDGQSQVGDGLLRFLDTRSRGVSRLARRVGWLRAGWRRIDAVRGRIVVPTGHLGAEMGPP